MTRAITNPGDARAKPRLLLAAVAVAAVLAGCNHRKADVTASIPTDYKERHPIVLSEAPRSIDIYAGAGPLDLRQKDDLAAFAAEYRAHGRSQIIAEVPAHAGHGAHGHRGLHAVREALSRHGVPASLVHVRSYPAEDHTVAAPIRLSYAKLQARVPNECGHWPEDLGAANLGFSASNRTYFNLGCATQNNLAASVADPLDFERARPEGRIDTARRMEAISKLRRGQDPSTVYTNQASQLNRTVGN
jgi:pilus assembly protein CpaD